MQDSYTFISVMCTSLFSSELNCSFLQPRASVKNLISIGMSLILHTANKQQPEILKGNALNFWMSQIARLRFACKCTIFTALTRSLGQGNIFRSVCQEFCPGGVSQPALQVASQHALQVSRRGGVVSQHALQVSRPTPKGKLRGLA